MVGGLDYEAEVQPSLAGQAPAGVLHEAVRPGDRSGAGNGPRLHLLNSKSPIIIPMGAFAAPWVVNGDGPGGPESVAAATTISDNVVFAQLSVDVGPENTVDRRTGWASPARSTPCRPSRSARPASRRWRWPTPTPHSPPTASTTSRRPIVKVERRGKPTGSRRPRASAPSRPVSPASSRSAWSAWPPPAPAPPPARTSRIRAPARRAPPRTAPTCGTPATRRSWRPPCGWATSTKRSAMPVYGGDYPAPMWAKFFAAALKDQPHPNFKTFPWTFGDWESEYSVGPSASASSSGQPRAPSRAWARPRPSRRRRSRPRRHAEADADQDAQRRRRRRPSRPDADGGAETGHPGAHDAVRQVAATARRRSTAPRRNTGAGDTGLAGAAVRWVAGLLGL